MQQYINVSVRDLKDLLRAAYEEGVCSYEDLKEGYLEKALQDFVESQKERNPVVPISVSVDWGAIGSSPQPYVGVDYGAEPASNISYSDPYISYTRPMTSTSAIPSEISMTELQEARGIQIYSTQGHTFAMVDEEILPEERPEDRSTWRSYAQRQYEAATRLEATAREQLESDVLMLEREIASRRAAEITARVEIVNNHGEQYVYGDG